MSDYQPRRPGSKPTPNRQRDRAGKPALGRPERGLIDESEARQLAEDRERMRRAGVGHQLSAPKRREAATAERPQVMPKTEGWTQPMGPDGRPQLQFKQPRVSQPPTHLADLTLKERQEKAKEIGLPAFRAKQLSVHYFEHYTTDPEQMTDLPKDKR